MTGPNRTTPGARHVHAVVFTGGGPPDEVPTRLAGHVRRVQVAPAQYDWRFAPAADLTPGELTGRRGDFFGWRSGWARDWELDSAALCAQMAELCPPVDDRPPALPQLLRGGGMVDPAAAAGVRIELEELADQLRTVEAGPSARDLDRRDAGAFGFLPGAGAVARGDRLTVCVEGGALTLSFELCAPAAIVGWRCHGADVVVDTADGPRTLTGADAEAVRALCPGLSEVRVTSLPAVAVCARTLLRLDQAASVAAGAFLHLVVVVPTLEVKQATEAGTSRR